MLPSTEPWVETWRDLPTSTLGLRIVLRRPADMASLVRAWLEFVEPHRPLIADGSRGASGQFVRIGSQLGNGEWLGDVTEENLERVVDSYRPYAGGVCAWNMTDPETDVDGALAVARASLHSDRDDMPTGSGAVIVIDREGHGVPPGLEDAWVDFLGRLGRDFEILYGEVSPHLDPDRTQTEYEARTGRRATYRTEYLEIEDRLRGCGWTTWVPSSFLPALDIDAILSSGFHRVEEVKDRGLLIRVTERAHEFTDEHQTQLEAHLRAVLEPTG